MKKALIEYMKNHFDYTYNFNIHEYTFWNKTTTNIMFRIEPFIKKYFNEKWELFGDYFIIKCNYFDLV